MKLDSCHELAITLMLSEAYGQLWDLVLSLHIIYHPTAAELFIS